MRTVVWYHVRDMKKIVLSLLLILVAIAGVGFAYLHLALPKTAAPRNGEVARSAARLERGKYLFNHVTGCGHCHSEEDDKRFGHPMVEGTYGQGKVFPADPSVPADLVAANITPDKETGVGNWTDGELIRAIREGISRDGHPLYPGMPYTEFGSLSDEDVESVVAYLRTIPAKNHKQPATKIRFPMSLIVRLIPKPVGSVPAVDRNDRAAYGKYLVGIAGCQFCHTPFEKGQPVKEKLFAGGHVFHTAPGIRAVSGNLTPEPNTGLGTMSEQQFLDKFFQYKDYAAKGAPEIRPELNTVMPWLSYTNMEADDLKAIYAYLRTLPPLVNAVVTHPDAPESKR